MSFGQSIATVLSKYADFTGRASRPEFWWWVLAQWLVGLVLTLIAIPQMQDVGPGDGLPGVFVLLWVVALALFLPSLAVTVRRLHDTNRSGAMIFVSLIPLIGSIILLVFLASEGTPGSNAYGPPPGTSSAPGTMFEQPPPPPPPGV